MQSITNYIFDLKQTLEILPLTEIDRVITVLHEARMRGRQVFIMGNGGSASTAAHMVCDLAKNTRHLGWPNFKVIGLADNMAIFSAYANDEGYENVFWNQLDSLLLPNDVVIAISASGNSPNVLKAITLAGNRGATTIAFTGFNGGRLSSIVDINLLVPSNSIEHVEDIHLILEHLITKVLREEVMQVSTSATVEELFPQPIHRHHSGRNINLLPVEIVDDDTDYHPKGSLDLFAAISRELAVELNIRDLLRRILRLTLEKMSATSGSILVLSETGGVVEGAMVYNGVLEDYAPPQFSDVLERGLAGWVVENRQAALVTNTLDDPRWLARLWEWEGEIPRSAISVPLLANDHVVGVLTLVNSQVGKFTEEDLSLLTSISTFVSLVNYAV